MDELRSEIWDYLSQVDGPQSLDELARLADRDPNLIRAAVDHEWFEVDGALVAIAYSKPPRSHQPSGWVDDAERN